MSFSKFIANKLSRVKNKTFTSLIILLAKVGVALSVGVMIVSVAIVLGYKNQITNKVFGINGHIEIHSTGSSGNYDYQIFNINDSLLNFVSSNAKVNKVNQVLSKPAILKYEEELEGIIFKGVENTYFEGYISHCVVKGKLPNFKDSLQKRHILISKNLANKLNLDTGNYFKVFFINEPLRVIPCYVSGIFETGMEETDQVLILGNIKEMQRIFAEKQSKVTHLEIYLKNLNEIYPTTENLNSVIPLELTAQNSFQLNPQIFDWLGYLDQNIVIIISLMILVSCVNMITTLLVLIIERTNMIGILKAIGSNNLKIRKIFLHHTFVILRNGLIWGNVVGLLICFLQYQYKIITLPQETYSLSYVPVEFNWFYILLINIGTIIICMLALILPSRFISKISPVKSIKFN